MTSPVSSTANIQKALDQKLESSSATTPVSQFRYSIIKEWPIGAGGPGVTGGSHLRSLFVAGFAKGAAADAASAGGGAPGGACWVDCSLSASATQQAANIIAKLKGSGASGPFG